MDAAQPDYHNPSTIKEACQLLVDADRPAIVAGGQSLTLSIEDKSKTVDSLVDINDIAGLKDIERANGTLSLGATVTHSEIETSKAVSECLPALSKAASEIADQQIRNAGTIGGTTAFRYHTADYPPVLVATDAKIVSRTETEQRERSAVDYFLDPTDHNLERDELITSIKIPIGGSTQGVAYEAFSYPGHTRGLVNTAVSLTVVDGKCTSATLVVGCVDENPQMVSAVTDLLVGSTVSTNRLAEAAKRAGESVTLTRRKEVSSSYLRRIVIEKTNEAMRTAQKRAEETNE